MTQQKPTIKEVVAAMQNDYKICWSDDTHAIFKAFLADDEPEQKIPLDYLSKVSKLQADLELAKEALTIFVNGESVIGYHLHGRVTEICNKLGIK